jgi:hypothetical protein
VPWLPEPDVSPRHQRRRSRTSTERGAGEWEERPGGSAGGPGVRARPRRPLALVGPGAGAVVGDGSGGGELVGEGAVVGVGASVGDGLLDGGRGEGEEEDLGRGRDASSSVRRDGLVCPPVLGAARDCSERSFPRLHGTGPRSARVTRLALSRVIARTRTPPRRSPARRSRRSRRPDSSTNTAWPSRCFVVTAVESTRLARRAVRRAPDHPVTSWTGVGRRVVHEHWRVRPSSRADLNGGEILRCVDVVR